MRLLASASGRVPPSMSAPCRHTATGLPGWDTGPSEPGSPVTMAGVLQPRPVCFSRQEQAWDMQTWPGPQAPSWAGHNVVAKTQLQCQHLAWAQLPADGGEARRSHGPGTARENSGREAQELPVFGHHPSPADPTSGCSRNFQSWTQIGGGGSLGELGSCVLPGTPTNRTQLRGAAP